MGTSVPRVALLCVSLVQGIALFALYRAEETNAWPSDSPAWAFPLWTLALAVPVLVLLSLKRGNSRRLARWIGVAAVTLVLVAAYTGWQASPAGEFDISNMVFVFVVSIALACFKALMYMQQRASQEPFSYQVLFTHSWRNFLVAGLAAVFAFLVWLLLMLWGELFNLIRVDFFEELVGQEWFLIPVLSVAFGLAVAIFRDLNRVIDGITQLLRGLIKLLLPLVVAIAVIFLIALPVVGFDALWATRSGTAILLWLLAAMLFFTNAVFQDGREQSPYPAIVHRLVYFGLCTMPILSVLSCYGLALRIGQYGWTIERAWAVVVWALLSLIALGYVVGIIRRRDQWTVELARVNTVAGLVVLAVMLLANSPVLDFRKLSLNSQLARVESGELELRDFDFWYTSRNLGRPGYLAMEDMKQQYGESDPELVNLIDNPVYNYRVGTAPIRARFWDAVVYRPGPFEVPDEVRALIDQTPVVYNETPVLLRADLNDDGEDEYVVLRSIYASNFYYREDGVWKAGDVLVSALDRDVDPVNAEIRIEEPRFRDIYIGETRLQLRYW